MHSNRTSRWTRSVVALAAAALTAATLTVSANADTPAPGPRAMFGQEDVPAIRAVAASDEGTPWAATVRSRADAALNRDPATTCQRQLRYDLPDLAMAWLLTDDLRYAQKTRDVLVGVNDAPAWVPSSTTPGCTTTWGDYGWRWPQLLAQTAYSYDWIRGAGVLSPADEQAVHDDLVEGGQVIYNALTGPEYSDAAGYRNVTNYRIRNDAGLGIVALVLEDSGVDDPASTWSDYVWRDLFADTGRGTPRYLAQMTAADGVYKEGQGYYQDSFRLLTPYFVATENLTGRDPFSDPLVHAAYNAPIATAMPDGSPPTVDTGWRSPAVAGGLSHWVAAQYPHEPWHRWQWQREGQPVPATDQPLSLALYRPGPSAPPPGDDASRFLTDNAYAALRTDWTPDASWLLLNAERVPDRSPHEQPDQTSFAYYAKGTYLAVDPGDGRNCGTAGDRWLRSSEAHSLVSVDGQGPRVVWDYDSVPDPVDLERTADVGDLAQSRVSMTYANGASTTRQTVLAGDDYAVVFDNLRGDDDASHDYRWRLHLADGGTMPAVTGDRATWSVPSSDGGNVDLTTVVSAGADASWSTGTGPTNMTAGKCTQHPYLDVNTTGSRSDLVSVLYPEDPTDEEPTIRRVDSGGGRGVVVTTDDDHDLALTRTGADQMELEDIGSDAARLYLSRDTAGRPETALVDDGRHLDVDDESLVQSSTPLSATLAWPHGRLALKGTVHVDRTTTVVLSLAGRRAGEVTVDGETQPSAGQGRSVALRLDAGTHDITVSDADGAGSPR